MCFTVYLIVEKAAYCSEEPGLVKKEGKKRFIQHPRVVVTAVRDFCMLSHLMLTKTPKEGIIVPILQMRTLRS